MNKKILHILLLCLISWGSLAAKEPVEIQIQDTKGSPIVHGIVKLDNGKILAVDSRGQVEIDLAAYGASVELEVYAIGFEKQKMTVGELMSNPRIILRESLGELDEYVLSATRTDRSVEDLPMPVTVLTEEKICETGAFRLSDVLAEQTGLQLVADHGTGLQMQGLDSEYILILLDGEPLIGRTAGTFDLDRISVSNIDRIEILRGPSSAIYGSEAMAGVINIITKVQTDGVSANLIAQYGSFNSFDLGAEVGLNTKGWNIYGYYDHYSTDGYDLNTESLGNTKAPHEAETAQVKLGKAIGDKWKVKINGRFYQDEYKDVVGVSSGEETLAADMAGDSRDININPSISFKPNTDWTFTLRNMTTLYDTHSSTVFTETGEVVDEEDFSQRYHRTEVQTDYRLDKEQLLTVGVGHQLETVEATRYDENNKFNSGYLYLQHQWTPSEKWNVVTGARGDLHSEYGGRISPKISAMHKFSDRFSWQGSIGAGFKSPDFRQLLLNFNNAVVGYYVYGSMLVEEGVRQLEAQGQLQQLLMDTSTFGNLDPENSWAVNTGFRWKATDDLLLSTNFFRNQISNLIETAAVARLTNGRNVYSYINLNEVITQGAEVEVNYRLGQHWRFSLGYVNLDSRDEEVIEGIERGEYFKRDSQNRTRRVERSDYGGLFNRSRHSGNVKVNYWERHTGVNVALRGIYRGKYGFGDINGNQILDDPSEYAEGIMQVHLTLNKQFDNGVMLETGVRNIADAINEYDSTNPGRTFFVRANVSLDQLFGN
ncbi:TonB-dependent receptor plug domain-containing protein [Echinicola rosea]|uniref:TonB-dependent receptor n=1 Tax=Echinicola rosea TaxID=1807691 RepID=A0ABQ1V176_9BACT|nr:TonB-dependent receptor [Echinicola rosea]GGF31077.1 TonB-dependent receptor [Echinicola rosea]